MTVLMDARKHVVMMGYDKTHENKDRDIRSVNTSHNGNGEVDGYDRCNKHGASQQTFLRAPSIAQNQFSY